MGLILVNNGPSPSLQKIGVINNNILHHQIINLNDKSLIDLTDSFKRQSDSGGISKFCSECGYANIDMKLICPECSFDLQMD